MGSDLNVVAAGRPVLDTWIEQAQELDEMVLELLSVIESNEMMLLNKIIILHKNIGKDIFLLDGSQNFDHLLNLLLSIAF